MLPYQRSYHITTLKAKLNYWQSPDAKKDLYPRMDFKPPIGIQVIENGYYYLSDNYVAYNDITNGLIVRIKKNSNPIHWKCFRDLYSEVSKSNRLIIDQPSFQEFIEIADKGTWEYVEMKSPNGQYGKNLNDEFFDDSFTFSDPDIKDRYLDPSWNAPQLSSESQSKKLEILQSYIEQISILIDEMTKTATRTDSGFPKFENRLLSCLYRDNNGYFWSDVDQFEWVQTKSMFLDAALQELTMVLNFAVKCGIITQDISNTVYQQAREKWLTI